jgi:hypothetical protein
VESCIVAGNREKVLEEVVSRRGSRPGKNSFEGGVRRVVLVDAKRSPFPEQFTPELVCSLALPQDVGEAFVLGRRSETVRAWPFVAGLVSEIEAADY